MRQIGQFRHADDPAEFGRVAVVYGGKSAEREVSLQSGGSVLRALTELGVDAHGVDADESLIEWLSDDGFNRVFIMLHGPGGEDGTLQGALEYAGIPYTGSGVLGSALAMDKVRSKLILRARSLATPDWVMLSGEQDCARVREELGFPVFVKPVHEGSSLGITRVNDNNSLADAYHCASRLDARVFAEAAVRGDEYTAAIVGPRVLPMIRLEVARSFYDYAAKYQDGQGTQYHCPSGLPAQQESNFAELCERVFELVGASGWGRVDFIRDAQGQPWFLEVNTAPGMTSHSLVPIAARAHGMSFPQLCWRILETSL